MPTLRLDIVVLPTYNTYNMAVVDASTYPTTPPIPDTPWIEIDIPGFNAYSAAFVPAETNIYNSTDFGITTAGNEVSLPDGIYNLKYTNNPAYINYVEKSILRVDRLQEKFDEAFMQLDMMECDRAIKTQAKVDLMSIWFFIEGAKAAANNCAIVQSGTLYMQANKMLDNMIANDCGCSGNNFLINFQ
jgi:hypothetical protein